MDNKRKKRGKSRYFLIVVIILGVLFFAGNIAKKHLNDLAFFKIKHIQIKGNKLIDTSYLYDMAAPFIGTSIFDIDLKDIEMRYYAHSRIKEVTIQKSYPAKIIVNINERKGVFFLRDQGGDFFPIDEERYVLDKADWYIDEDLPLVNLGIPRDQIVLGQKIEDARLDHIYDVYYQIIELDNRLITDISEFYYKDNQLNFIDIKSGCRIILTSLNLDKQVERFLFLRDNQGFKKNSIIDLRFDGQVVVL